MYTVSIKNLSKMYRSYKVLDSIHLDIQPGLFGLLGPNGAGKTTLMKIMSTLLPYKNGTVMILGYDVQKEGHSVRKQLGYLPQHFDMPQHFTGREFLHYVASMKGINRKEERQAEVDKALLEVNLVEKADKKVKTYSGGMKRRMGIAQALLGSPKILILDEPTAGLDPGERIRLRNLIEKLSKDRTILLSTHIISDIETSCERVAVINKGRVEFHNNVNELAHAARGVVWELTVPIQEYDRIEASFTVTSSKREGREVVFRIVAKEQPDRKAVSVTPSMEDGYIAILNGVSSCHS